MELEDETEKAYYKELERRLINLEKQAENVKSELEQNEKIQLETLDQTLTKLTEIKKFFEASLEKNSKTNSNEQSSENNIRLESEMNLNEPNENDFVRNKLEEFKENSMLYINREKLKFKEENENLKKSSKNTSRQ